MDLLDNLDTMFPTFIATPKTTAFASICLGIGVWMSTTSLSPTELTLKSRQSQARSGDFTNDA